MEAIEFLLSTCKQYIGRINYEEMYDGHNYLYYLIISPINKYEIMRKIRHLQNNVCIKCLHTICSSFPTLIELMGNDKKDKMIICKKCHNEEYKTNINIYFYFSLYYNYAHNKTKTTEQEIECLNEDDPWNMVQLIRAVHLDFYGEDPFSTILTTLSDIIKSQIEQSIKKDFTNYFPERYVSIYIHCAKHRYDELQIIDTINNLGYFQLFNYGDVMRDYYGFFLFTLSKETLIEYCERMNYKKFKKFVEEYYENNYFETLKKIVKKQYTTKLYRRLSF